jgi:hypothetical protein
MGAAEARDVAGAGVMLMRAGALRERGGSHHDQWNGEKKPDHL